MYSLPRILVSVKEITQKFEFGSHVFRLCSQIARSTTVQTISAPHPLEPHDFQTDQKPSTFSVWHGWIFQEYFDHDKVRIHLQWEFMGWVASSSPYPSVPCPPTLIKPKIFVKLYTQAPNHVAKFHMKCMNAWGEPCWFDKSGQATVYIDAWNELTINIAGTSNDDIEHLQCSLIYYEK